MYEIKTDTTFPHTIDDRKRHVNVVNENEQLAEIKRNHQVSDIHVETQTTDLLDARNSSYLKIN